MNEQSGDVEDRSPATKGSEVRSSLSRAIAVLNAIANEAPESYGVSAIARLVDTPKAVVYRILKEYVKFGYLLFDDETKRYRLGPDAIAIGLAGLRSVEIPTIARPYVIDLMQGTDETATLSIRDGWNRIYLDQAISPQEIRMAVSIGTRHDLFRGSSSKAILAALDEDELEQCLQDAIGRGLFRDRPEDRELLRVELDEIRQLGYAASKGERQPGAGSVAAPVFSSTGVVFGSISLCGPANRIGPRETAIYGPMVAAAANAISRDSGATANWSASTGS